MTGEPLAETQLPVVTDGTDDAHAPPPPNWRGKPKLDESVGVHSKYWAFTCDSRNEFDCGEGLRRIGLRDKGVFAGWNIDNGKVTGYIEFRVPVTEAMLKNRHGYDLSAQPVKKKTRAMCEEFMFQEEENIKYRIHECRECASLCYDRMRKLYEGDGTGYGLCVDCGGTHVTKMPAYVRDARERQLIQKQAAARTTTLPR